MKKSTIVILLLLVSSLSFFAGWFIGKISSSVALESKYNWALHRKIGQLGTDCSVRDQLQASPSFVTQTIEQGNILLVASLSYSPQKITAFAINVNGEIASDSWEVNCDDATK